MFQEFINKLIRLEDDGTLVEDFIKLPEKPSEMQDLVTSLNIVGAKALIDPWLVIPDLSATNNNDYGLGLASARWHAQMSSLRIADDVAKKVNAPRPPAREISPLDLDLYEKRVIFQLAWMEPAVLYHLESVGLKWEVEEQAELSEEVAVEPIVEQAVA